MRALVFADTHGSISACINAVKLLSPVDLVLHLGDYVPDARKLKHAFPETRFEYVAGNNDYGFSVPEEKVVDFAGRRIFITHGHREGVKTSLKALAAKVKKNKADMGLFGHTHRQFCDMVDGVWLMNPGSASKRLSYEPSCGVLEFEGKLKGMIFKLNGV